MKQFLFVLSFLTHPVFIPLYAVIIYHPLINKHGNMAMLLMAFWIFFGSIMLPFIYFVKGKGMDLKNPDFKDREAIFKSYALIYLVISVACSFLTKELVWFFVGLSFLNLLLFLLALIKLKASWHSATWAFLAVIALVIPYNFGFVDFELKAIIVTCITLGVSFLRLRQGAHTTFELGMGLAAGALAGSTLIFL